MNSFPSTPTPTESATAVMPLDKWTVYWAWRGGLVSAFASATGISHTVNEDCCLHFPSAAAPMFCAAADGVGGGAYGEVASHALAQHCAAASWEVYRNPARLVAWLKQGDAVVREAIALRSDRRGASTLVAAWFLSPGKAHLSNIGDCRAYCLRPRWFGKGWHIRQLTQDQTYANLKRNPPPGGSPGDPACMAGVGAVGEPPVTPVSLGEGELLLLCSDGLHKFVTDADLAAITGTGLREGLGLQAICQRLVEAAQRNGSHDDISALLVQRRHWFGARRVYWLALLAALLAVWKWLV